MKKEEKLNNMEKNTQLVDFTTATLTTSSTTDKYTEQEYLNQDDSINRYIDYDSELPPLNKEHFTLKPFTTLSGYAGCYCLGGDVGLKIYFGKKPKWLHRKMMKLCLGWEWIDN